MSIISSICHLSFDVLCITISGIKQAVSHPKSPVIITLPNPGRIKTPAIPWWGVLIVLVIGAGVCVLGHILPNKELEGVGLTIVIASASNLLGISIGIKMSKRIEDED